MNIPNEFVMRIDLGWEHYFGSLEAVTADGVSRRSRPCLMPEFHRLHLGRMVNDEQPSSNRFNPRLKI
jgi:hypothetical protein